MGKTISKKTADPTKDIKKTIANKYNEEKQELNLSILDTKSEYCEADWRSVLEFRTWTTLRIL